MKILSDSIVSLSFDHGEVHDLSVGLLRDFHEDNTSMGMAALACALTLGRLLSTDRLEVDEELKWLEDLLEWSGAYFAEGSVN